MLKGCMTTLAISLVVSLPVQAAISTNLDSRGNAREWQQDQTPIRYAGGDKVKWKAGGCKYEYKADAKGIKEKYKCK
jgi:hypothetical protein